MSFDHRSKNNSLKIFSFVLVVVLLTASFLFSRNFNAQAISFASEKIEPGLYQEIASQKRGSYFIQVTETADLTLAYSMTDRDARGEYVYNTLLETANNSQADLKDYLDREMKAGNVSNYQSFFIINAILVTSDVATLDAVAARDDVQYIFGETEAYIPEPEVVVTDRVLEGVGSVEWGVGRIRADEVWATFGTRGEGIVVANIDTGVRATHAALNAQYRGTVTGDDDFDFYDPANICGGTVCDNNDHGTHTMGTMVGDDGSTNQIGVAPDAQWIAAKGCEGSKCSNASILSSAQWMLAPCAFGDDPGDPSCDPAQRPHIINNSWGGPGGDSWYQALVAAWDASGILHTFSAGNSGPGADTVSSPSDYCNTNSTGATDINDAVAGFSSRGPGAFPACTDKPNVSAPGANVRSSVASSDVAYANFNGTSMASPHVAGCMALLLSMDPSLDQPAMMNLLQSTAVDLGAAGFDYDYGHGRIDCYEAARELQRRVTLTSTPEYVEVCQPDTATFDIFVGSISGFDSPVTLSNDGGGSHAPNPVTPPMTSTMTISTTGYPVGLSDVVVTGSTISYTKQITVGLFVSADAPGMVTLTDPADQAQNVIVNPTFSWAMQAGTPSYLLEVADDINFTNIVYSATTSSNSHTIPGSSALNDNDWYFWRVTGSSPCGDGMTSAAWSFRTANPGVSYCATPALSIPDNTPAGVQDTMNLTDSGTVLDVDIYLGATHPWVGDLQFDITHNGTTVTIFDRPGFPASTWGCDGADIDATINDQGTDGNVETACGLGTPTIQGDFVGGDPPNNSLLSAFDGMDINGDWTITASDHGGGDTGTLNEWCLVPTIPVAGGGVDLSPSQAISSTIGSVVAYTLSITNTGATTHTFDLEANSEWAASLSTSSITLAAGETDNFMVMVPVSGGASDGDMGQTLVTAVSQSDASANDFAWLTTTASAPLQIYLPVVLKP